MPTHAHTYLNTIRRIHCAAPFLVARTLQLYTGLLVSEEVAYLRASFWLPTPADQNLYLGVDAFSSDFAGIKYKQLRAKVGALISHEQGNIDRTKAGKSIEPVFAPAECVLASIANSG